jgi:hypothetical protein
MTLSACWTEVPWSICYIILNKTNFKVLCTFTTNICTLPKDLLLLVGFDIHIVVEIHVFLFCLINTDLYITNNTFIYIKISKFGIKFGFWKVLKIYWYFLCGQICSECPYCELRRIFSIVRILSLYFIVVHVRTNLKICQTTCFLSLYI